jgi:lysophospholipid acyltransferase (LPLAT)-like uncharacterized protein
MQIPVPFARVALVMSAPVELPTDRAEAVGALEAALARANGEAEALVGAAPL